jgi:heptosyltransferase-2
MMRLWRRRFDLALLPRWDTQYRDDAFLAYFSGAARRVGYSEKVNALKSQLNRGFDALLTHPLLDTSLKHEVERSLGLLHFLGGRVADDRLELWTSQADEDFASAVLAARHAAAGGPVVAFSPSAGRSPLKQWPVQRFAELGQAILQRTGARILLVGGPEDAGLGEHIERALGAWAINLVGKTTLRQLVALLKRSAVFVGNDSGPMHIAAASDTPVVALFGSSCPHRFGPWTKAKEIIVHEQACAPCHSSGHLDRCRKCVHPEPACMQAISVQEVLGHVLRLLARGTAPACPPGGAAILAGESAACERRPVSEAGHERSP